MRNFILASVSVFAMSSIALAETFSPNLYECKGPNVAVAYSSTSFFGKPSLEISTQADYDKRSFTGTEIRVEKTAIGELVSVRVKLIPDSFMEVFTLQIPAINLSDRVEVVKFATSAFDTKNGSSFAGPGLLEGQIQISHPINLVCEAKKVIF